VIARRRGTRIARAPRAPRRAVVLKLAQLLRPREPAQAEVFLPACGTQGHAHPRTSGWCGACIMDAPMKSGPRARLRSLLCSVALGAVLAACGSSGAGPGAVDAAADAAGDGGTGGPIDLLSTPLGTGAPALPEVTHGLTPTGLWGTLPAPHPTNAWFENLALGQGMSPVNVLPYLIKALPDRLSVCHPGRVVSDTSVLSTYLDNLSLGAAEAMTGRALIAHDGLSATMRWHGATAAMQAPLVRGMAYATMRYEAATPRISTQHAITSIDTLHGRRFVVALNNGQTWILYASADLDLARAGDVLTAAAPFTGTLRAALDPGGAAALLDAHAAAIPTGGAVHATADGDTARLVFDWTIAGTGDPLMMALPHQRAALVEAVPAALTLTTIKGDMTGVIGARWTMVEALPTITWTAPRPIDPARKAAVAAALVADRDRAPVAGDPYFFGKQAAALGRLALIADELGDTATAATVRAHLRTALAAWLEPGTAKLVHDTTWGGIVATGAEKDPGAAFGQGYYNDHHFHYGYFLYAAAALARGDAAWAAAHKDAVLALARDIANPSTEDPYFTVMRNKDWFDGHSWAAGVFEFADSRNQESSSEAINAWYGLALWGLATNDTRVYDLGRLLLATELRSVHAYWQVTAAHDLYGAPFSAHRVVGVLWATKVDYATFFGTNPEFIHAIQMLPFTPITEALLPRAWITEEYPVLTSELAARAPIADSWRGFVIMDHAILDPAAAWTEAQGLTAYDDGNSATNTLYWIATRPPP
jgi:endo-1,3(4)-beta-glucanase